MAKRWKIVKEDGEAKVKPVEFEEAIEKGMEKRASLVGVDFKKNVSNWIKGCRKDGGIPMFMGEYGGEPLATEKGKRAVLGKCWGGKDGVHSRWFVNVPKKDLKLIKRKTGEWKELFKKYGKPKEFEELEKEPILIR